MKFKNFIKTVFDRYTSIGLLLMGVYNIFLIFLYFTHKPIPSYTEMFLKDAILVIGSTVFGLFTELLFSLLYRLGVLKRSDRKQHE